jgi:hypothetical protein
MYCFKCGKKIEVDSKFCEYCGANVKEESKSVKDKDSQIDQKKPKNKQSFFNWLLWWQIDMVDIKRQVDQYDKAKFTESAKGMSLLLGILSTCITLILIFFDNWSSGSIIDALILLFLCFMIFKGKKWASVVAMLYWTFEKFYGYYLSYQNAQSSGTSIPGILGTLIWWAIFMHVFYNAYKVESLRGEI